MCRTFGSECVYIYIQGSHKNLNVKFKDNSRTFQGQMTKIQGQFIKFLYMTLCNLYKTPKDIKRILIFFSSSL